MRQRHHAQVDVGGLVGGRRMHDGRGRRGRGFRRRGGRPPRTQDLGHLAVAEHRLPSMRLAQPRRNRATAAFVRVFIIVGHDLGRERGADRREPEVLRRTRCRRRQTRVTGRFVALPPVVVGAAADVRLGRGRRHRRTGRHRAEEQPALAGRRGPKVGPGEWQGGGFGIHRPIIPPFRPRRTSAPVCNPLVDTTRTLKFT